MPEGDTGFRALLRFEINPGMEEAFEREWLSVGRTISGHPDNRGQLLMKSGDEEAVYYVLTEWSTERAFREFEHSAVHVENRRRLQPFRRGGWMSTMTVVHALAAAAPAGTERVP
ncbi:antibiotic biosynthesis monooxygenase family protein [Amycolatopsis aidingensis]|uniref:antibiotic biosynthesis monooxygenase family protein n=1 Tax=Amycolatopsis aidingensis TaxID=2842453 RepID=UPI001C0E8120|nr:antibiotic biosynthesis monooxygenase family protein [Amycolatopsis aidingensis]